MKPANYRKPRAGARLEPVSLLQALESIDPVVLHRVYLGMLQTLRRMLDGELYARGGIQAGQKRRSSRRQAVHTNSRIHFHQLLAELGYSPTASGSIQRLELQTSAGGIQKSISKKQARAKLKRFWDSLSREQGGKAV